MIENKFKVLTTCPNYSVFNGVEFVFLNIKKQHYKMLIKNKKKLKKEIETILKGEKIKEVIKKIYLSEMNFYRKFIKENENTDINEIYKNK